MIQERGTEGRGTGRPCSTDPLSQPNSCKLSEETFLARKHWQVSESLFSKTETMWCTVVDHRGEENGSYFSYVSHL